MICIDFVAGTHGNYLEFVLNKLVYGHSIEQATPFNVLGASHNKHTSNYQQHKLFYCDHWHRYPTPVPSKNVITIQFDYDDLLPLMTVSLLRAANRNIQDNDLEHNTFHKLNNGFYQVILEQLEEFYNCRLDAGNPDCERYILREFFKFGFRNPETNGYIVERDRMVYNHDHRVYNVNYRSFYNTKLFARELDAIKSFFNLQYQDFDIEPLHQEFLSKQFQITYKAQCDAIVEAVKKQLSLDIPQLSLFQESYINGCLDSLYHKEMPFVQKQYFTNTKQIIEYLNEI
jgi:hypothetical protein